MSTSTVISPDDPAFDVIQDIRDIIAEIRRNPKARILDRAGLITKRNRTLDCCRYLWQLKCPEHGTRKTRILGCGDRTCRSCRAYLIQHTMAEYDDKLNTLLALQGDIVRITLEYHLPKPFLFENLDFLRTWIRNKFSEITREVDRFLVNEPTDGYFRSAHILGINNDRMLVSVFLASEELFTLRKSHWEDMFYDACTVESEGASTLMSHLFFLRHVTPLQPETKESEGLHEVLFNGMRMLRSGKLRWEDENLSVSEETTGEKYTDNSSDSPPDPPGPPPDSAPAPPSHHEKCSICGRECYVSIEVRGPRGLLPIAEGPLPRSY